jgi:NAD dependent epimerase/dehydratase family enzyme
VFAAYDASHSADNATRAIQRERVSATRRVCEDQNLRNKATIDALNKLSVRDNAQAQTPEEKKLAQQRIDGTKALVNALAPVRNCPEVVKATVGTEVPAPE